MALRAIILVVDDEEEVCAMMKALLENAGHQVVCAGDGNAALRQVAKQHFDVVVTDLLMPGKDGIETITDLRHNHPEVRVVAMSGGGRVPKEKYLHIARGLGAHDELPKPFTREELLNCIERVCVSES